MKTFYVTTKTDVNESGLLSVDAAEFRSASLDEAKAAFEKEVEALGKNYTNIHDLSYDPTEEECRHAFYCTLSAIDDEDEDVDPEWIETSDLFFEK